MNLLDLLLFLLVAALIAGFIITLALWAGLAALPDKEDDFFTPNQ